MREREGERERDRERERETGRETHRERQRRTTENRKKQLTAHYAETDSLPCSIRHPLQGVRHIPTPVQIRKVTGAHGGTELPQTHAGPDPPLHAPRSPQNNPHLMISLHPRRVTSLAKRWGLSGMDELEFGHSLL